MAYWPIDRLIAAYVRTCQARGEDPAQALSKFLADTISAEDYWKLVDTNLKAGRVRMVFVADEIPAELRRIIEFLNGQMDPAEVLAVEIKQFKGHSIQTLVSRVLGMTAEAEAKKRPATTVTVPWTEATFVEAMHAAGNTELEPVLRAVQTWATDRQLSSFWGTGPGGGFGPNLRHQGRKYACVYLTAKWKVSVAFTYVRSAPGFESEASIREFALRLNKIEGANLPVDSIPGWAEFPMTLLIPPASRNQFLETLDWFYSIVREHLKNQAS